LLKCGPVGQYQYQWLDCAKKYRDVFIDLKIMFEISMRKASSPEERAYVLEASARLFSIAERLMPIQFQTFVRHHLGFHTVEDLEDMGPYTFRNTLDFERFHTTFKTLCRNRNNPLASIESNYELLEFSLTQRMVDPDAWTLPPPRSTPAGYLHRPESSRRGAGQLDITLQGLQHRASLSDEDFCEVQRLWRICEPAYNELWKRLETYNRKANAGMKIADVSGIPDTTRWALSDEERLFQQMTNKITVASMLNLHV
jgi:hypothetical protein